MYSSLVVDLVASYIFFMSSSPLSLYFSIVQYTTRLMYCLTLDSGGIPYILVLSMSLILENLVFNARKSSLNA